MPGAEKYTIILEREGGIHPGDVPAAKLAELLRVLARQFADGDEDFCLSAMEDNCVRMDFRIHTAKVRATTIMFAAFLTGQLIASNSAILRNLAEIDRVRAKFDGVSITFPAVENYPAVTVPPDRKLSDMIRPEPNIHFQHTVYGKVVDVGGDRPNIHIKPLGGGAEIICDCTEELAAEVAHLLYSIVGITGEVTKSIDPIRMKALALLPYRKPTRNPFEILKEAGAGKYFESESVEEFMRKVRGNDGDDNA